MSDDCYEATIRYWANIPVVTHRIVVNGKVIGHYWSDGCMTLDNEPAHQESATPMSGAPPK